MYMLKLNINNLSVHDFTVLSRDPYIGCAASKKPLQGHTLQQKSPLRNNSPSNIKYSFKIIKSLTGDWL